MVDSRKMHKHVSFIDLVLGAWVTLDAIVPKLGLIEDVFLVLFLAKKVLQSILLDVARYFDLRTKPAKGVGVGEDVNAPVVNAKEEKSGVETVNVLCGQEIDLRKGVGREKNFPLYIRIEY